MGITPRVNPQSPDDGGGSLPRGDGIPPVHGRLPVHRRPREFLPSQSQAMALLSRCIHPSDRALFEGKFKFEVAGRKGEGDGVAICATPVRWIENALDAVCCRKPKQLVDMNDMFPTTGTVADYGTEVYVMDVILNRAEVRTSNSEAAAALDPDRVLLVKSFSPDDQNPQVDYKFRTMIAFLPAAGTFYCARERRRDSVGVAKSLVQLDMSWLRMQRNELPNGSAHYTFGEGGYVRKFASEVRGVQQRKHNRISAWKFCFRGCQQRVIYRALQCHDSHGPKLAPDFFNGEDAGCWPRDVLAEEYNKRLARSNSLRSGGRHYAAGCHHFSLPPSCWLIDPRDNPFVDIMIDVAPVGLCMNRQSVLMIRQVDACSSLEHEDFHTLASLNVIADHNAIMNKQLGTGTARAATGDVGTMHAIGTRVDLDGVTVRPYQSNEAIPQKLLRQLVCAMSTIGKRFFPDVLAVIADTECDSGLEPVPPMDGVDGHRVGYTVDMSVNLGNSSHYDVHDASQGFSIWTEELIGQADNWFFIMPNIYGKRPDGTSFSGLAVKLHHGTAISWDGRVIRHCTSLSKPDGSDGPVVKAGERQRFKNHVFGTFTAAKERIVQAGRAASGREASAREVYVTHEASVEFAEEDIVVDPVTTGLPGASMDHMSSFQERMIHGDYYIPKRKRNN